MPLLDRWKEARLRRRMPSRFDSVVRERIRILERKVKFLLSRPLGWILRPRRAPTPLAPGSVRSVLLLRYDALGDAVLTTAVFRAIKRYAPHIRIGVAASDRSRSIFEHDPDVEVVYLFSESPSLQLLRELKRARARQWDVVINLVFRDKTRGAVYSKIVAPRGISVTAVREKKEKYSLLYSAVGDRPVFFPPTPMARQILHVLLDAIAFPKEALDVLPQLPLYPEVAGPFQQKLSAILEAAGKEFYILINTDAAQQYREWGIENSIALAHRIVEQWPGAYVFLSSAPSRYAALQADLLARGGTPAISVLESRSALHLAVAVRNARAVVSPDTSVVHFATAQNVPVVGLYVVENEFLPYGGPSRVILPPDGKTIAMVTPEQVFQSLQELLRY